MTVIIYNIKIFPFSIMSFYLRRMDEWERKSWRKRMRSGLYDGFDADRVRNLRATLLKRIASLKLDEEHRTHRSVKLREYTEDLLITLCTFSDEQDFPDRAELLEFALYHLLAIQMMNLGLKRSHWDADNLEEEEKSVFSQNEEGLLRDPVSTVDVWLQELVAKAQRVHGDQELLVYLKSSMLPDWRKVREAFIPQPQPQLPARRRDVGALDMIAEHRHTNVPPKVWNEFEDARTALFAPRPRNLNKIFARGTDDES